MKFRKKRGKSNYASKRSRARKLLRRTKPKFKAFKKKVLKVIRSEAEDKSVQWAYNTAIGGNLTASYIGGSFGNFLSRAYIIVGRGHNQPATNANTIAVTPDVGFDAFNTGAWDPTIISNLFPNQGDGSAQRNGNNIRVTNFDLKFKLTYFPGFWDTIHFTNDVGIGIEPVVVFCRWEPTKALQTGFIPACQASLIIGNLDFCNFNAYGTYIDWPRVYGIRCTKIKRMKFPMLSTGNDINNAGVAQDAGIFNVGAELPVTYTFQMGKKYKGLGKSFKFAADNSASPDEIPFYITYFIVHPSAFTLVWNFHTRFYDI